MARKTIVKEAVAAVRTVAGAALDAAAEEARRVVAETVADTAVRGAGKGAGKKKIRKVRPAAKTISRGKTSRRSAVTPQKRH